MASLPGSDKWSSSRLLGKGACREVEPLSRRTTPCQRGSQGKRRQTSGTEGTRRGLGRGRVREAPALRTAALAGSRWRDLGGEGRATADHRSWEQVPSLSLGRGLRPRRGVGPVQGPELVPVSESPWPVSWALGWPRRLGSSLRLGCTRGLRKCLSHRSLKSGSFPELPKNSAVYLYLSHCSSVFWQPDHLDLTGGHNCLIKCRCICVAWEKKEHSISLKQEYRSFLLFVNSAY